MTGWSFADVWEIVANAIPDAPALVHGDRVVDWRTFDAHANGIAATLLDAGLARQDKVAQYLYNGPEYIETLYATWKAALVPVNTNYRYTDDEIVALWDNADVRAVVFHADLAATVGRIRDRLPAIERQRVVDDERNARAGRI